MNNRLRLNRLPQNEVGGPKMIAVASGKGGVGKSVVAFNLAERVSIQKKTLLVDADFTLGNQHLLANVSPACGWQTVCSGENDLSDALTPVSDNLDLLPSAAGSAEQMLPDIKKLAHFLGEIGKLETYEIIIFDTASGILPHTNLILSAVDEIILITTPELTAISDSYALFKIVATNSPKIPVSLLVNRVTRPEDSDYIYQKFSAISGQFLGCSPNFWGSLSDDSVIVDSVAHQATLAEFAPDSDGFRQMSDLAERFSGSSAAELISESETTNFNPAGADIRE